MDFEPSVFKKLIEAFKFELDENLQIVSEKILFLESSDKNSEESLSSISELFRAFHTIKGSSHAVGLINIANLAHNLEDLYSKIKIDPNLISTEIIDITLEVTSEMKKSFEYYLKNSEDEYDLNQVIEKTKSLVNHITSIDNKEETKVDNKVEKIQENIKKDNDRKIKIYKSNKKLKKINNGKDKEENLDNNSNIIPKKNQPKKSIYLDSNEQLKIPFNKVANISALGDELKNIMIELNDGYLNYEYRFQNKYQTIKKTLNGFSELLDVDSKVNSEFLKIVNQIDHCFTDISDFSNELRENSSRLNLTLDVLRDSFQELSLVSISLLINTLNIIVRDLSKKIGKEIKLNIIGDDVKLDRNVLDKIKDPLIHIIRNAIDHGIEDPQERIKLGKPEIGHIIINIGCKSGRAIITIEDDGSGINIEKVKEKAIDKKIITIEEINKLNQHEIMMLIFKPGFSIKENVTEISGRGVGLDIVANNITAIKGKFDLQTKPNMGTKFILDLPLSLTTENGIIIRAINQKFVIPALAIKKIMEVNKKSLKELESEKIIIIDDKPVPIYGLNSLLKLGNNYSSDKDIINIIIISIANEPDIGLLVDEVINQREVIVKRLPKPLNKINCISGIATIGKEGLLVVLNTPEIVRMAISEGQNISLKQNSFFDSIENKAKEVKDIEIYNKNYKILVVDDSITTRTVLSNALKIHKYDVVTSNNGEEAWSILSNEKFDLIITDIMMPNMDGFELTKKIKNSEAHKDIPVIVVTSLAKSDDRKKGIDAGADAYLVKKHFENNELIEIVSQLLVS